MEESLRTDLADRHFSTLLQQFVIRFAWAPLKFFVSINPLRVDSRSSTFSYTPRSREYFNSMSRALRTSCNSNSMPMTLSKQITCCSYSSISVNIACFHNCVSRSLLKLTCTISLRSYLSFPRQFLEFSDFQLSQLFNLPMFPNSPMFAPPVATFSTLSLLMCSATHLLFLITLVPSTSMYHGGRGAKKSPT